MTTANEGEIGDSYEGAVLFGQQAARQIIVLSTGQRVVLCESGCPKGNPVFLVTGSGGCRIVGLCLHSLAKQNNVRLLCFDKLGVGLSDDPVQGNQTDTWGEAAETIIELADHFGIQTFGVIAHSLGCLDSLVLAKRYPHRLRGPVQLFSPWVMPDMPHAKAHIKLGTKLPESLLQSVIGLGGSVAGDPYYAWIGNTVKSLTTSMNWMSTTSTQMAAVAAKSKGKNTDDALEDGKAEENDTLNSPDFQAGMAIVSKLIATAYSFARNPNLPDASAAAKLAVCADPNASWVGADVTAELESGFFRPRPYLGGGILADTCRALGKRGKFTVDLRTITHPVHIHHGTDDGLISVAASETMAHTLPYCKLSLTLKGTHNQLCNARLFVAALHEISRASDAEGPTL
ncbi:Alpha/Beta hydrolase protein [Powellomyces hirtus]|nr:Alpha/Beta hydrolase protein [Powellomyces hirtus]